VQRRATGGAVEGAAQRLAVDCQNPGAVLPQMSEKLLKAAGKRRRVQQAEDTRKGVVAGQTTRQLQKFFEQHPPVAGEQREVYAAFRTTNRRRQSDRQHFQKVVPTGVARPRIGKPLKGNAKQTRHRPNSRHMGRHTESISPNAATPLFQMRFPCSLHFATVFWLMP
jgi:hypothetical protein